MGDDLELLDLEVEAHLAVGLGGLDVPFAPAVAAPLPDPIDLGKPAWDVGVEMAEVATTGRSICIFCKGGILRGSVRLKYWQNNSTFRFVHPSCAGSLPEDHKAHSCACLRYQSHFAAGKDCVEMIDSINEALSHL